MRKSNVLLMVAVLLFAAAGAKAEAQLEGVESLRAMNLTGELHLVCDDGKERVDLNLTCQRRRIEPGYRAHFRLSSPSSGNFVTLRVTRESGETKKSSRGYDSELGRSTAMFNLWYDDLYSGALFGMGNNKVHFEISDRSTKIITAAGEFEVQVIPGPDRTCQPGTYRTDTMSDCQKLQRSCDEYFAREHYCQ